MYLWNRAYHLGGGVMYDPIDTLEEIASYLVNIKSTLERLLEILERGPYGGN